MPMFEYKCTECGLIFEELKTLKEDSSVIPCRKCGADAVKQMSAAAFTVSGGSTNETVDMTIGRIAERRWQEVHDQRSKRIGTKPLQSFDLPKSNDGKFMPIMALGTKQDVQNRKEFVTALQEDRKSKAEKK